MFEFALWWAWLLLPLPWLLRRLTPPTQSSGVRLALPKAARFISPRQVGQPVFWQVWILPSLIWTGLVAGLAQPQWVGEPISLEQEQREMYIALDLSGSMQADDMTLQGRQVTRLRAAHHILAEFIERRHGDRIGLIVYADEAFIYSPMTNDLNALAALTREAQIGLAGQRTALGDAVALSIRAFNDSNTSERVVLLLTDGMINSGTISADDALTLARNHQVRIHTIGIGADEMVVQGMFGQRRINPSAELDETFLTQLAQSTGGEYFRARNEEEMRRIYDVIDDLEPVLHDTHQMRPRRSLAHWPFAASAALTVLAFALYGWRRQRERRLWTRHGGMPHE